MKQVDHKCTFPIVTTVDTENILEHGSFWTIAPFDYCILELSLMYLN